MPRRCTWPGGETPLPLSLAFASALTTCSIRTRLMPVPAVDVGVVVGEVRRGDPRSALIGEGALRDGRCVVETHRRHAPHRAAAPLGLTPALEKGARAHREGLLQGLRKGFDEGRNEGLAPLAHLFARKLGRPLDDHEREILIARLGALGPDRLGDIALDLDGAALALWLADPSAR